MVQRAGRGRHALRVQDARCRYKLFFFVGGSGVQPRVMLIFCAPAGLVDEGRGPAATVKHLQ